ncbi:MAG TPA: hypothetical protein VI670_27750 [Thermoanaerobaculia bacterium]|jgi:hypothetical protein
MDFLKKALQGITGDIQIGDFGAIHFGGKQGTSATVVGRASTGDNPPLTGAETKLLVIGAIALVVVYLFARRVG